MLIVHPQGGSFMRNMGADALHSHLRTLLEVVAYMLVAYGDKGRADGKGLDMCPPSLQPHPAHCKALLTAVGARSVNAAHFTSLPAVISVPCQ